jgi:hypothetical protein
VFTDDPRFTTTVGAEAAPPQLPLEAGAAITDEVIEPETITFRTNRPGHPVLVRVSYHPRWRVEGADGPYLASPALMMVVPREGVVRLVYARNWSDHLGLALSIGTALVLFFGARLREWAEARRGRARQEPARVGFIDACDLPPARERRWGGLIPGALLSLLVVSRFFA